MYTLQDPAQRRWTKQYLTAVRQWAPHLRSISISKPEHFRFSPGHYARLGLPVNDTESVWRPYSIVSEPSDPQLEFLITFIPGGAFCSRLALLTPDKPILLESAALGFFVEPQLAAGETLWMLATGAGLGPYVALLRTTDALKHRQRLVLVHSARTAAELAYAHELTALAAASGGRFHYVPVVTREAGTSPLQERIPTLIADGALQDLTGISLNPISSRIMVCGNPEFTAEMRQLLNRLGFSPCRRGLTGTMLFENYW